MRLQQTVNSPTQPRIIQHKQGRDGGNNKARAHNNNPSPSLLSSASFSPSSARSLPFFSFPSSPHLLSPLSIHPSILLSLTPHPSTVVALVTIQRDFLCSSVTVATLGFPPGHCWKRAALRSTPGGMRWPPADPGRPLARNHSSADASVSELRRRCRSSKMERLRLEILCFDCGKGRGLGFGSSSVGLGCRDYQCLDWNGFTVSLNLFPVFFLCWFCLGCNQNHTPFSLNKHYNVNRTFEK